MEMGHRLRSQDQRACAGLSNRQSFVDGTCSGNRLVRAGGDTLPAEDAVLFDNLDEARLGRQGDGVGRTDPNTGQAGNTARGVNGEMHEGPGREKMQKEESEASWRCP